MLNILRAIWNAIMSFFKKLTTLVQAQINNVIDPIRDETEGTSRRRLLARREISQGLEGDVTTLRQRVNDALAYEGKLQAKLDQHYQEINEWDAKADQAVADGREDEARVALCKMHSVQRQVEFLEADLREHRFVTQELMNQVNQLETVLEQAKREQAERKTAAPTTPRPTTQIQVEMDDDEDADNTPHNQNFVTDLAQKLDTTRQKLGELIASTTGKPLAGKEEIVEEVPPPPAHPVDRKAVDADLARRINRLAKPDDKDSKK
jgi:phage shock protein A